MLLLLLLSKVATRAKLIGSRAASVAQREESLHALRAGGIGSRAAAVSLRFAVFLWDWGLPISSRSQRSALDPKGQLESWVIDHPAPDPKGRSLPTLSKKRASRVSLGSGAACPRGSGRQNVSLGFAVLLMGI